MGVQLDIKSAEAHALAEELAAATGRRRDDLDAARAASDAEDRARYDRIMAMTEGNRSRWDKDMLTIDHGDLL